MSDRINVKASDRGLVWVFAIDLEGDEAVNFNRRNGEWPAQKALGAETLEPEHVEVFQASDLEGVGLAGYLEEGMGVPRDQLQDMRARLDAQQGWVMVVTSKALGGKAQTLTPRAPLRLIGSFSEYRPPVSFETLPSGTATGTVSGSSGETETPRQRNWLWAVAGVVALAIILTLVLVAR
ncbi:MAG: hypothetical protein RID23_03250 [Roseovarius sp.]